MEKLEKIGFKDHAFPGSTDRHPHPWVMALIRSRVQRLKERAKTSMGSVLGEGRAEDSFSLPGLLKLTWNYEASDDHDKIYALLSIAEPILGTEQGFKDSSLPPLTIDYAQPVRA